MGYPAVTAFLHGELNPADVELAMRAHFAGKTAEQIIEELVADIPNMIELKLAANANDELRRGIRNLEHLLSERGQTNREKLLEAELASLRAGQKEKL